MRSSIANLKESLNKIAQDVHDDDDEDELGIYGGRERRRLSYSHAHFPSSPEGPTLPNGIGYPHNHEIEQYKAEIKRLKESEAEIKALSINYAALLKEKEDRITQLNQEFESLKQNLGATKAALKVATNEASRASSAGTSTIKGRADQSPIQPNASNIARHSASQWANGSVSKQHGHSNGFAHSLGSEKELADLLEEKRESLSVLQANHERELQKLREELERERDKSKSILLKLQEEQKKIQTFEGEFNSVKLDRDKASEEVNRMRKELSDRGEEISQLQKEKGRKKDQEATDMGSMKKLVAELEQEKANLKNNPSGTFPGKDNLQITVERLEKDLKVARGERDKAALELARLKQHLLEKESEESEKMDEDSKIIEELQRQVEYQRVAMLKMENALKQAYASQEETRNTSNTELQKYKEAIADLKEKLGACMCTIDAKNTELLNLETALGQYYAEVEAKERLEGDLSVAREECSKLGQSLQDITHQLEASKEEKEEIMTKLVQMENMVAEGKSRVNKLEEDNAKLRRALEQSMTRLNRMSVDSDFLVDRRIVIKLLVTYFQRNHSKEVLELMVRMLGFSNEDKQRIGVAQLGTGKGVVRNVLGLPGRLVGGMLSNSSSTTATQANDSDNQSFADLWVDFLLKESEEREKRESMEAAAASSNSSMAEPTQTTSPSATTMAARPPSDERASKFGRPSSVLTPNPPLPLGQTPRTLYSSYSGSTGGLQQYEYTGSEFSTVPLTPSQGSSWSSKLPPKY